MSARKIGVKAAILAHVEAIRGAADTNQIEERFQGAIRDLGFSDRRLRAVEAAMVERGRELCVLHPRGGLVPSFGAGRHLEVCGERYRVGRGQNSTGVRYAWSYAEDWATAVMHKHGLSKTAAHLVWGCWGSYPHRALRAIEEADTGAHADPTMNVLLSNSYRSSPIHCEIGEDNRAHRPCECGGTLFDWGASHNGWAWSISWRCNRCPVVFYEYVDSDRLRQIRNPDLAARMTGAAA